MRQRVEVGNATGSVPLDGSRKLASPAGVEPAAYCLGEDPDPEEESYVTDFAWHEEARRGTNRHRKRHQTAPDSARFRPSPSFWGTHVYGVLALNCYTTASCQAGRGRAPAGGGGGCDCALIA